MSTICDVRVALCRAGYSPIPVNGKRPTLAAWEQKARTNPDEIALWEKLFPDAVNTGILTQRTPTLDIDILNPEAAVAVEELVRERFEERGHILTRIGRAPKRAILFRTETGFKKITCNVVSPAGSEEKLELLGDGQQVVVHGIHKDTGKPYSWHGGELSKVRWEDLPYITSTEAQALVDDAERLLIAEHGYKPARATNGSQGETGTREGTKGHDWAELISNILSGRELHDSICAGAAKLIANGMSGAAAMRLLEGWLESSSAPRDERWQERLAEIPRAVASAERKFTREAAEPPAPDPATPLIVSSARFIAGFVPPDYILDGVIQRGFLYALTARTGDGKTAIALLLAACVAQGIPFAGHTTEKGRVLFFAGENPQDIRTRWIAMSEAMSFDINTIDVHFIPGAFKLSALSARIAKELEASGPVALVIVDTSAAFFEGADENSNVEQVAHARRMRNLISLPGGPCVLINCHPVKNASDDNLIPRGGGAFIAEIDGNLTALKDDCAVTLHTQGKHRGADFAPMSFMLKTDTYDRIRDVKGRLMPTVIARHLSDTAQEEIVKCARSDEDSVMKALKEGKNGLSVAEVARALGWYTATGEPYKSKTHRILGRLKKAGLAKLERGRFTVTDKGRKIEPD